MSTKIVLDTNVFISALRSRNGASFKVLKLVGRGHFDLCLSVPLVLEYEATGKRHAKALGVRQSDVDDILNYLCQVSEHCDIYYLWRPFLKDPKDDMVLELAVRGEVNFIVTHNLKDFEGIEQFAVRALNPKAFLREIGELP